MNIHLKRLFLLIPCDRDLSELPSEHLAALRPIPYTHRNNPKESKAATLAKQGTKPGGFPWMSTFRAVQNADEGIASTLPLPHTSDLLSALPHGFPALSLPPRTPMPAPAHSLALLAARCSPSAFFGVKRGAWGLRNRSTVKAFCYTSR